MPQENCSLCLQTHGDDVVEFSITITGEAISHNYWISLNHCTSTNK